MEGEGPDSSDVSDVEESHYRAEDLPPVDPEDEKTMEQFMSGLPGQRRTLADIIQEKLTEKRTEIESQLSGRSPPLCPSLCPPLSLSMSLDYQHVLL